MNEVPSAIREFLEALGEAQGIWQALDIRVLAVRIEGEWHNIATRVRIDPRSPNDVPRLAGLPLTESVSCWQLVQPVRELAPLLSSVAAGYLQLGSVRVHARERELNGFSSRAYRHVSARLASREQAVSRVHRPQQYVAHILTFEPQSSVTRLADFAPGGDGAVRRILQSLERPLDGLTGATRVALESGANPDQGTLRIDVVAPLGVSLDATSTRLEGGRLTCQIWAGSTEAAGHCSIGYIAEYEDRSFLNGTLSKNVQWTGISEQQAQIDFRLPGNPGRVVLLLRLGSFVVETHEVYESVRVPVNTRYLAAYEAMDPGLEKLRDALLIEGGSDSVGRKGQAAERRASKEFEQAVSRLFELAGFHSAALDSYAGMTEAPDILAHHPTKSLVLVVECTLGPLQSKQGKPARLLDRVLQLRQLAALGEAEVVPVMAVGRARENVSKGELDSVGLDDISVLTREDLVALFHKIKLGASVDDVVSFCREYVPTRAVERSPDWLL